jgi:hypothetical protein
MITPLVSSNSSINIAISFSGVGNKVSDKLNPLVLFQVRNCNYSAIVATIRESKKDIQDNGVKKKDKRTNNDLQNTTQKTKD